MGKRGWRERNACVGVDSQTGLYLSTLKIHPRETHPGCLPGQTASCCLEEALAPVAPQRASAGLQEGLKLRKGPVRQGPAAWRATTKLR